MLGRSEIRKVENRINEEKFIAAKQLLLMMALTIATQVVMLLKVSTVASSFGTSIEMDAFNFANNIGNFIYSFIGAGVTTVLIPNLVNKEKNNSINIFISILYSSAFIVLVVVHIFRRYIVAGLSNGSDEFILITCNIMFITLITQYINSFTGATNAIFQCSGKFNFPKFITLCTTIFLVLLLIFTPNLTVYKYVYFILITTVVNVAFQIYLAIKGGYSFKFSIDFKDIEFRKMMKVFTPTVLSTGLYQVSLLTDSIISSNLGQGEISKLSYSNTIMTLINTVILSNIMTYFYPKIAKDINKEDGQKKLFDLGIYIIGIMVFMVVGFITVGRDAIVVLYERGNFTSSVTSTVYMCTLIYVLGLPINAFRDLIYRYFYAKGDTLTPFRNSLLISFLNIVISIILARFIGIYGIVLGTVITSYMSLGIILFKYSRKFGFNYSKKLFVVRNAMICAIAVITLVGVFVIKSIFSDLGSFMNLILYGICTILIYTCGILFLSKFNREQ